MHLAEEQFLPEVQRFRRWVATIPTERQLAEWECNYSEWADVYKASTDFLAVVDVKELTEATLNELLFIIAADNECQIIAGEIAKYPEALLYMAQAALRSSYANAKWQLAIELGNLAVYQREAERILYALAKDEDEYTRRRALGALAEAGSSLVNELIEPAWLSNHQYQRMMVLSALHKIASPELERYLALAETDGREYLVAWASHIRRGQTY